MTYRSLALVAALLAGCAAPVPPSDAADVQTSLSDAAGDAVTDAGVFPLVGVWRSQPEEFRGGGDGGTLITGTSITTLEFQSASQARVSGELTVDGCVAYQDQRSASFRVDGLNRLLFTPADDCQATPGMCPMQPLRLNGCLFAASIYDGQPNWSLSADGNTLRLLNGGSPPRVFTRSR